MTYHYLEEKDYKKAVGQLRLQLNGVFKVFDMYGMGAHIPMAIEEVVVLADLFSQRVRGKDVPIMLSKGRKK